MEQNAACGCLQLVVDSKANMGGALVDSFHQKIDAAVDQRYVDIDNLKGKGCIFRSHVDGRTDFGGNSCSHLVSRNWQFLFEKNNALTFNAVCWDFHCEPYHLSLAWF